MRYIFILLALLCASCGTALPTVKPYKLDVQQGNVVTSKMLLQLRPGMTKSQVRFIMGTPLIQDSFHANRWDYVYQMREGGKIKEQRRVILDFENDLLKSVRGDVIPVGSDPSNIAEPQAPTGTRVVTPIKKPEEKGLLQRLKFWEKDEAEMAKEAAEKEAAAKEQAAKEQAAKEATAKARREAEEAARNAAVQRPQETPAVDEPKSLLAVPIEVPGISDGVTSAPAVAPALAEPPLSPPPVEAPKAETVPVETVMPSAEPAAKIQPTVEPTVQPIAPVAIEPAPAPVPVEQPAQTPTYESSSGMQFDKKLRLEVEEDAPPPQPAVQSRTGKKEQPVPKELPQEAEPSLFDRILEQIGF